MEEVKKSNAGQGLGIAGLVLGIIALIIAFIPCVGALALIPGLIAIILSAVGLSQANKVNASKGLIIAGLVIAIIAVAVALIWTLLIGAGANHGMRWKDRIEKEIGTDFDKELNNATEDFGDDMEDKLQQLEQGTAGDTLTSAEFDKLLVDYESLIKEYIKLSDQAQKGEASAIVASTKLAVKAAAVATKLSSGQLTDEQMAKFEELQKKYEEALSKVNK
jgi:hypothetical protein